MMGKAFYHGAKKRCAFEAIQTFKIMARKEVQTDLWVCEMLKEAELDLHPQDSNIKEINEALQSASKAGTDKVGFPEYCGTVKDFVLVIEDKADVTFHEKRDSDGCLCNDVKSNKDYAGNIALWNAHCKKYII